LNPSTTAGDIEYRSSTPNVNTRLPLGTAGQVLKVNSGATAPEWSSDNAGMTNPMTTTGDTIYSSSGSTPARLALGTAGQILKVNSGATAPEWGAAPTAGANWSLLNSGGTALTGAQTITISGISGADKIMAVINYASAGADTAFNFRLNADTGNNYDTYAMMLTSPNTYSKNNLDVFTNQVGSSIQFATQSSNGVDYAAGGITVTGCNSAGVKAFQLVGGSSNTNGSGSKAYVAQGVYNSSSTITSISIVSTVGNFDNGTIYVYTSA
jgi:hypothetical protein